MGLGLPDRQGRRRSGRIGRPILIESSVCRHAPPRGWRGRSAAAGTILHDWGAHLVDQALQLGLGPCRRLTAWLIPAPWENVDSGGHGRIMLGFDDVLFQIESSRICRIDRPRWWIIGTEGGFVKYGIDPQEEALRAGDIDRAAEARRASSASSALPAATARPSKPNFRRSRVIGTHTTEISPHTPARHAPLAVTAEQAREVVRVLEAATHLSSHASNRAWTVGLV